METITTLYFWIALWPVQKDEPVFQQYWRRLGLIADHSLPFTCLIIEAVFLNSIPFCKRHISGIIVVCVLYLFVNMAFTISTGVPVYAGFDWSSILGFVLPIALLAVGILWAYAL